MPDTTRIPGIDKEQTSNYLLEELRRERAKLFANKPTPDITEAIREESTPPARQRIPGVDYDQVSNYLLEELRRERAKLFPEEPAKKKPDQEQRGFFAETGSALAQGFVNTGESIASTGEMLGVPGMKSSAEYLRKLREHEMLRRPDYLAEGDILENPERLADWRWWVRSLGENIPNLLAVYGGVGAVAKGAQALNWGQKAIRATALTAGFGGSFSIEAGAQYSQAKQEMQRAGLLDDDAIERIATAEGLIAGTINAILEVIPADNLIFRNKDAKKILSKIIRQGLFEGGTEVVQEAVNVLVSQYGHAPDQNLSTELGQIIEAGLIGLVLGGGAAGVHAPFESRGGQPTPADQTPTPSAQTHTDMPIVPSNDASKTHVTEEQRQADLDKKHADAVQKKATDLFTTITAQVAAENEALEKARAEEIARREAETAARAAQEQAEIDAAVVAAQQQQTTLKTTLAADNPQKQAIVDDVLSLTEKRLITALQKEMGLTITPAGQNLYSLETPAGPVPANLFDLRQRLAQHRIRQMDQKIAQQQADEKALAELEERRAAQKAKKDEEERLAFVRGFIARGSELTKAQIDFLDTHRDRLTTSELDYLDKAKTQTTKTIPASVTLTTGLKKPQDTSIIEEATNPDFQPTAPGEEDQEARAALIQTMIADIDASTGAGLTHTDEGTTRHSAGITWLTEANKRGSKTDRAEARTILTKAQNNQSLTPRQKEIFDALVDAADKIYGMTTRISWAAKGFEPLPGKKLEADDLVKGDRFVIADEEFRVTDIDDAGNVTMKDGTIRKVRQGSTIDNVDYFKPNKEATSFDVEDNTTPKTQKDIVKQTLQSGPKSIKQIAEETKILEPNIRRILGMGAKEGIFERVDKGVYILNKDGKDIAFIETGNALEALPRLAAEGFKADMIFLDIPYKTPAVVGGNRGIKYDYITPDEFDTVVKAVKQIARHDGTPVFYMYSQARSGQNEMAKYTKKLFDHGFMPVAKGEYTKLQKDGITQVRNMRGDIIEPEGIILFNQVSKKNAPLQNLSIPAIDKSSDNAEVTVTGWWLEGKEKRYYIDLENGGSSTRKAEDLSFPWLNFRLIRPKGYQTEKPAAMLKALIETTTQEGDMILDPFAGSGVTGEQAILAKRNTYLIEKSAAAVEGHIKPKIKQAAQASMGILPKKSPPENTDLTPAPNESKIQAEKEKQYVQFIEDIQAELTALEAEGIDTGRIRESFKELHKAFQQIFEEQLSPLDQEDILKIYGEFYQTIAAAAGIKFKGWRDGVPVFAGSTETGGTGFEKSPADKTVIAAKKRIEALYQGEAALDVDNFDEAAAQAKSDAVQAKAAAILAEKEEVAKTAAEANARIKTIMNRHGDVNARENREEATNARNAEIAAVLGYTKPTESQSGWDSYDPERVEIDLPADKKGYVSHNYIMLGKHPNGMYSYGIAVSINNSGISYAPDIFGKVYDTRQEALAAAIKEMRAEINERANNTAAAKTYANKLFTALDKIAAENDIGEKKIPQSVTATTGLKKPRKLIGKNPEGYDLYEDENGVRSYTANNIRREEPVQFIPVRGGVLTEVDKANRRNEFKTTEEVKPAETEKPAFGSKNKIFTEDKAARAREILKKKFDGTQLNTGIDPEILTAGIDLAGYYIEAGARSFMDFSTKMIADIGEAIRPYLKSLYMAVRNYPGVDKTGMNTEAELDAIDENEIGKEEEAPKLKEHPKIKTHKAQKPGDTYIGEAWRVETNTLGKNDVKSALDKINFEIEELGNKDMSEGLAAAQKLGIDLGKADPDDIIWVTRDKETANELYGYGEDIAEKVNLPKDAIVLTDLGGDGVLVYRGKLPQTQKEKIPASVQATTGLKTTSLFGEETEKEKQPTGGKIDKQAYPVFIDPDTGKEYRCILHATDIKLNKSGTAFVGSGWEWYGFEKQGKDIYFGLVHGFETELGSFSLSELRENNIPVTTDPAVLQTLAPPIGWTKKETPPTAPEEAKEKIPQSVQATTGLKPATATPTATPAAGTADLDAYGLKVSQGRTNTGKTVWNVTGPETRTWKEYIKQAGGRWYGPKKVWSFFNGDPSAALLAALPPINEVHQSIRDKYAAQKPATPAQENIETAPAQEKEATAFKNISDSVFYNLKQKRKFSREDLFKICDAAFGGTLAEGKYSAKDAYDALEMGINKYLYFSDTLKHAYDTATAKQNIAKIKTMMELIPTQTTRTAEMEEYQQFSTVPPLAYVANWVANLQYQDVYLEPSAGTGNLATFARLAGIPIDNIIVNELATRRAMILKELGFTQVFTENAEQINNILPWEIKPTVVVMNPPFSSTAGRMAGQRKTSNATVHIEQALKRLQPGGRLVGIVGNGMADDKPAFRDWWAKIEKDFNVLANIGISGKEYAKYGTSFDNQIIVIDKPLANTQKKSILKVTGKVDTVEELITLLEGVRNDRITIPAKQAGTQSEVPPGTRTGEGANLTGQPVLPPTDEMGATPDRRPGRPLDRNNQSNDQLEANQRDEISDRDRRPGTRAGELAGSQNTGRSGAATDIDSRRSSDIDAAELSLPHEQDSSTQALTIGQQTAVAKTTSELTDTIFDEYKPAKLTVAGAQPHPGKLVESAAMATVEPIDPTYAPHLPDTVIKNGNISIAQLEAVVYAGQAHSTTLPNGQRRGFFIGDGTGVGKGREIAAILWDNWNQGRKKAVWLSQNSPLLNDAKRDVAGVGWNQGLLFDLGKIKLRDKIKTSEGICFVGYGTLRSNKVVDKQEVSRLDQIVNWLGEDFDGVLVFDEAHNMGNALTTKNDRGKKKASETALAGIELQNRLPNARVVYVSATGATEVMNLAYATRLGLWGDKTPFPTAQNFVESISAGGVTAMELVAMNLKASGTYMARSLSFDDIKVERLQHTLTPEQKIIYDELAAAWQIVQARVDEALKLTGVVGEAGQTINGDAKSAVRSAFWGTNQRFWNQIITSMQMPTLIKALEADIAAGHAPILQLVNTNEAAQERAIAKLEEDETLEDLDITPREALMEYIKNSFPVHQYEIYTDEEGNVRSTLVKDSAGNPVINPEAVALREELLNRLGSIRVPDGPLEIILDHFGVDNVAEVTGRTRRVVYKETKNGRERIIEPWSKAKSMADADAFMSDRKKILVFSQAGGTGRSYHADNTAKNKRLRRHYVVQAGWRADTAVQGLGRSHRTNQAQAPEWILLSTDLEGQKRFISTIARRLNQLGALTKGSRDTGSQGLFSARDNLESREAKDAWIQLLHDIHHGEIPNLTMAQFMEETGLDKIIDPRTGNFNQQLPDVTKFLNRILNLKIERQNTLFEEFSKRINIKVAQAIENGTLDAGVETIRAKSTRKLNEQVVHQDERTKAKATYLEVELTHNAKLMDYPTSKQFAKLGYARNLKSGRVWALTTEKTRTDKNTGDVRPVIVAVGPGFQYHDITKEDLSDPTKYAKLTAHEAEAGWINDYNAMPKEVTETVHMVTGSILPIWDRLPTHRARIYRLNVEGKNIIGRVIDNKDLQATLTKLNATRRTVQYNPAEVLDKILNQGYTYTLANNWKLRRRKVAGEARVELEGAYYHSHMRELEKYGVFMERINYNTRLFIPTNPAAGARAIAEIIETRPIVAEQGSQQRAGDVTLQDAEVLNDLGQFYEEDPDTKLSAEDVFYSQLTRVLEAKLPGSGTPENYRATIAAWEKKGEFKTEELEWSGLMEWLAEQKGKLTKQEIIDFVRANQIQIKEITKSKKDAAADINALAQEMYGFDFADLTETEARNVETEYNIVSTQMEAEGRSGPKYAKWQLPGGENYREILFVLPVERNTHPALEDTSITAYNNVYQSAHWQEPNVLAHVRMNDRVIEPPAARQFDKDYQAWIDAGKKGPAPNPADYGQDQKILFIEEIQSDWHQEGRKRGYRGKLPEGWRIVKQKHDTGYAIYDNAGTLQALALTEEAALRKAFPRQTIPDAPFKKTWHELVLKRLLRYAAENGYDKIAWTTGEQQADRYDLSKQLDRIEYEPIYNRAEDVAKDRYTGKYYVNASPQFDTREEARQWANDNPVTHYEITAYDKTGNEVISEDEVTLDRIEEIAGKEIAEKIKKGEGTPRPDSPYRDWKTLTNLDLKIEHKGMKGFYDQIIPAFLNKYAKKWGARTGKTKIASDNIIIETTADTDDGQIGYGVYVNDGLARSFKTKAEAEQYAAQLKNPVHSLDITPQMKEAVMAGQPLFRSKNAPEPARVLGEAQIEELAEQLKKIAKGIKTTKKDGVIWLQTKSGDTVRIEAVEEITPESVALTLKKHYAQDKLAGKRIAGMYQPREKKITLVKNTAGIWTLSHEFYHFLEDIGAISNEDKLTLNRKINSLIAKDPKTYGYLQNRSLPERRAEWAGRTLAGVYDATTATGKILAKIREIIDMIINALGIRTAQGVIRDIQTGEIYKPFTAAANQINNILKDIDNITEKPYPYAEGETADAVSDTRGEDADRGTDRTPGIQGYTPTVVGREKAGTLKAASKKISTARDAAQIAAPYLSKYPDEHLISLVMDGKHKLLNVFAHTTGLRNQTSASVSTLAGDALNTPGAKYIIVAHNHPSGSTQFSAEDKALHQRLENLLRGSGVTLLDTLTVTKKYYASYMEDGGYGPTTIPAAESKISIPITRRIFETAEVNEKISSIVDALNVSRRYIPRGGALLLNNQNRLTGTLNITDYRQIRGALQREILQALEKHNASAVIIFTPDKTMSGAETTNIKNFFEGATNKEITVLDILDQTGSKMQDGTLPSYSGSDFLSVADTAEDLTAKVTAAAGRKISRAVEITTGRISPDAKPTLDKLKKHWQEFWRPFSTLDNGDKALTARYQAMGNVAKALRFIDKLKTELDAYPPEVKKDMFWYLNGDIPVEYLPDEAREMAQNIKRRTEIIGEMLVDRGILTQETFDKHKGKYIHYMYAKHIVGEDGDIGVTPSGKLDLSYTLARNPNLTTKQRRELGLIEDASVAVPVGMGKALTDIAKFDYLETIANNPEWVWQPSVVRVAIGAKLKEPIHGRTRRYVTMSVGKLVEQVKIYNEMMRTAPSPDVKEIHDVLTAALDRAQTKAQKAPEDYVELPNTRHYGPLAGAFVAKPIADDLKPVMDIAADQGALFNTMLKIHREGMAYFKMGKVALNVPTAVRNIVSNIIQQNMRGRSLPNVIRDIIAGIESFKAKDKIYEEAFGMGLFNTNWFTAEINDVLNEFRKAETGRWDKVLTAVKNVAKYYGRIDDIAKLAIFKQMRQSGATIDEAALEAMKWGMDYSLTSRSIKGLRQTIVPFATYQYKIAPLIAESLIKRPWVLAKFALLYPAAKMLAMSLHDLDDDDWEDLEKQLPAYIKNAGSVMILPWKSPAGHWQWVNMEYFFPWGNYLELFRNIKEMDTGDAMRDLGISNPFLGLFYTGLSARDEMGQPPKHSFYGTPIYNQLDPAPLKAAKYLEYVVNTWMPAMLTRQGALGYTGKAIIGQEDRWGKRVTVPQALARWFGVNIVSVSPEQSRAQISVRLQDMHKEMARIDADPSRGDEEKEAYRRRFDQAKADLAEQAPAAILPITKAKGNDPVYNALRDMAAQGILKSSPPSRTINIHGVPIKMSMAQYRDYLETSSDMARRKLTPAVTAPGWEQMPAWRKAEMVDKIIAAARKQVRQRIKLQMQREYRDKIIAARRAKRQI